MLKIKVTIVGTAPLLGNRFPDEEHPEKPPTGTKGTMYNDDDEAKKRLYLNGNIICQPANHIEASMIKSAAQFKFGGHGKATYKDAFKGGIFINPILIPHKFPKYEKDRQPVVIGGRSRIMRVRPRFDKWELSFEIEVIDDRISPEVVKEVLNFAGLYKGLGDMRPRFGRFKVVKFEVVK